MAIALLLMSCWMPSAQAAWVTSQVSMRDDLKLSVWEDHIWDVFTDEDGNQNQWLAWNFAAAAESEFFSGDPGHLHISLELIPISVDEVQVHIENRVDDIIREVSDLAPQVIYHPASMQILFTMTQDNGWTQTIYNIDSAAHLRLNHLKNVPESTMTRNYMLIWFDERNLEHYRVIRGWSSDDGFYCFDISDQGYYALVYVDAYGDITVTNPYDPTLPLHHPDMGNPRVIAFSSVKRRLKALLQKL